MLAFNIDERVKEKLAGFSVRRRFENGNWVWLQNRLSFDSQFTAATTASERKWFSTNEAPYQKFWWVDFPPEEDSGTYEYEVCVKRFVKDHSAELTDDQKVQFTIDCKPFQDGSLELAFTRGYLSSQAYAERFKNQAIRPKTKSIDFDTTEYEERYSWLGAHARCAISQFLDVCFRTPGATLDVLVYDLDEPSIINKLVAFGSRLRIVMDNAKLHTEETALEPKAKEKLIESAGDGNLKEGNFSRYQHNKVMIMRDAKGEAIRVLTGSTNFSINGLYVNANHVAVFDDAEVARYYGQAFDKAFSSGADTRAFTDDEISNKEFSVDGGAIPKSIFTFAPHKNGAFALNRVAAAINKAQSSVLFAVMALKGGGDVLNELRSVHNNGKVFSYGVSDNPGGDEGEEDIVSGESSDGVTLYAPDKPGVLIKSSVLNKLVPYPFVQEVKPGLAHLIHHKFVVVDFNGDAPVVFFGSSNFANGGEADNGDNLIAIYDAEIATVFAIEAIRLVDHYAFREIMGKATDEAPLRLKFAEEDWARRYYEKDSLKYRERELFSVSPAVAHSSLN
jgi:phosphatidylserine/phosphatidylglycerophosphate/cardiolipin synthase-like enzyme